MDNFWLVWKEDGNMPRYKHPTEASARAEAERLARTVGGKFHVLGLIATAHVPIAWDEQPPRNSFRITLNNPTINYTPMSMEEVGPF